MEVAAVSDLTALALNAADRLPVAELHGAVCGLAVCYCGAGHSESLPVADLLALLGVDALTDQISVERFVSASVDELQSEDLSFAPLLPADDVALEERLEALGQWCSSFLAGLAAGLARQGVGSLEDTPEQVREIVRDFAAIAQVDPAVTPGTSEPAAADVEAAEADFVELEEFVKVGALLIMSSLGQGDDGSDPNADDPAG